MKYTLFLGCTVPARARNYEMSSRKVGEALGLELEDMESFSCCGFPIKSIWHETFLAMAARNLAEAEAREVNLCTLCSACTAVLTEVNRELKKHGELREKVNKKLEEVKPGLKFEGKIEVRHFARILYEDVGVEKIKEKITVDLSPLKIAPHYGCHYMKPSEAYEGFENCEDPKTLGELIEAAGAKVLDYEDKKWCCGGGILAVDQDVAMGMSRKKLTAVKASGADALLLVCPFCAVMYDDNQKSIESKFSEEFNLPVLYLPQLLGLGLGISPKDLGLNMNRVKAKELLEKISLPVS